MSHPGEIRFRGKTYPVLDRLQIGRKGFLILRKMGSHGRERLLVFDRDGGPEGDLRTIHVLPHSRRARQQANVLSRISEGNMALPTLVEYHSRDQYIYLITKWVWGQDLAAYLDLARSGKTPWPSVFMTFQVFRKFAHGLAQLHQHKNLIHGDIKPDNLILCREPYQLVLIDFGSAWLEERAVGREEGDGNSDVYAAPECRRSDVTPNSRSDQFSASVIFYEMLTGEIPYDGMGGRAGWENNRSDFESTWVAPSQLRRDTSPIPRTAWQKIDQVVRGCLELDPDNRFATDGEWLDALDDIRSVLQVRSGLNPVNRFALRLFNWVTDRKTS